MATMSPYARRTELLKEQTRRLRLVSQDTLRRAREIHALVAWQRLLLRLTS